MKKYDSALGGNESSYYASKKKLAITSLLILSLGLCSFLSLYSFEILYPSNIDWLKERSQNLSYYLEWNLRFQNKWDFYPEYCTECLLPILFSDEIPLLLYLYKVVLFIISFQSKESQFIGINILFGFILNSYFAWKISSELIKDSKFSLVICTLLFILSPTFVDAIYSNWAYSSQFLLLAGFYLLISSKNRSLSKWLILIFVSSIIFIQFVIPIIFLFIINFINQNNNEFKKSKFLLLFLAILTFIISINENDFNLKKETILNGVIVGLFSLIITINKKKFPEWIWLIICNLLYILLYIFRIGNYPLNLILQISICILSIKLISRDGLALRNIFLFLILSIIIFLPNGILLKNRIGASNQNYSQSINDLGWDISSIKIPLLRVWESTNLDVGSFLSVKKNADLRFVSKDKLQLLNKKLIDEFELAIPTTNPFIYIMTDELMPLVYKGNLSNKFFIRLGSSNVYSEKFLSSLGQRQDAVKVYRNVFIEKGITYGFGKNNPGQWFIPKSNGKSFKCGWGEPESWGTWSLSKKTCLIFPIENFKPQKIKFNLRVFGRYENGVLQPIKIKIGSVEYIYNLTSQESTIMIDLTDKCFISNSAIGVEFFLPNSISPKDLNINSQDTRELAIGLVDVVFY